MPTNTALQQKTREKNTQPALQFEEKIILSNMVIYLRRHFAHIKEIIFEESRMSLYVTVTLFYITRFLHEGLQHMLYSSASSPHFTGTIKMHFLLRS